MQSPTQGTRRAMRSLRSPTRVVASAIILAALLYIFICHSPSYDGANKTYNFEQAGNSTLGFEKILVIGLKERTDRRDVMSLQASATSLDIEFIDGVKGETMVDKALPYGRDRELTGGNAAIGSWRGHIDAIRFILEKKLSSALIMEDDIDWDIRIKSQMIEFAKASRSVLQYPIYDTSQASPYGDDWDIMWPGHCGEILPESEEGQRDMKLHITSNDVTVAPKDKQPWLKALAGYPEQTRIVHTSGGPICTFAYAVSYKGAQKIMAELGIKGSSWKYDNALSNMCRDKTFGMKCVSVQPMLFNNHRAAGPGAKDSDILVLGDPEAIREKGYTECMVWSTRLNLENLVTGNETWVTQW